VSDLLQFAGKRVVVTGSSSGMGRECARILTELGAEVHGIDIKEGDLPLTGFHPTDLGDRSSIDAAVEALGGPVDSLFCCAGLPTTAPSLQVVLVNFVGHRHLVESLVPAMLPGSSIGIISSAAGMAWLMKLGDLLPLLQTDGFDAGRAWCEEHADAIGDNGYGFSKEAICAYVAHRGFQLASEGIRLNGINPGPTDTPMMPSFVETMGQDFFDRYPKPLGRNSRAEEQAWSLIFLNSPRSSYVAGTTLFTDGGFSGGLYTGGIDPAVMMAGG
jgi:NAD(P)-dependent dehydrogenase (short-subunit alcohol dehydrogenase family)